MSHWMTIAELPYRPPTFSERLELINLTIMANEIIKMEKASQGNDYALTECLLELHKEDSGAKEFMTPEKWIREGARINAAVKPYWIWKDLRAINIKRNATTADFRELLGDQEMICLFNNLQIERRKERERV